MSAPPGLDPNRPPVVQRQSRRDRGRPSVRDVVRMWWMLTWRLFVVAIPTVIDMRTVGWAAATVFPVLALVTVVVFRKTITHLPELSMLVLSSPLESLADVRGDKELDALRSFTAPPLHEGVVVRAATRAGEMTGRFEPHLLEHVPVPAGELVCGTPGSGLAESGFDEQAIKAGQAGESNLAKILGMEGLTDKYATFWSVGMPGRLGIRDEEFEDVDIDLVLVTKHSIWLVDVKNYRQGDVTYLYPPDSRHRSVAAYDNETGARVGEPYKMSSNMSMAKSRFEEAFGLRGFLVKACVVMMPTDKGMGDIGRVYWPGPIKAITVPAFLKQISRERPFSPNRTQSDVVAQLTRLGGVRWSV